MKASLVHEVFVQALRLGATSFGGPIAHLGYFERAYVRRLRWLDADEYAGLVATCQVLPGPTSSQVGFLIGLRRAGWAGAFAAWLGFAAPSALLMLAFAWTLPRLPGSPALLLHGLALATVAVVAQAVSSMAQRLCTNAARAAIALLASLAMLSHGGAAMQFAVLATGAVLGMFLCRDATPPPVGEPVTVATPRAALVALVLAVAGIFGAFAAMALAPRGLAAFLGVFYRAGALVFGGGHVVLPLLRDGLVPTWIGDDAFLSAYGFAQALPGPLFAIAAYLGATASPPAGTPAIALLALLALFLPGMLLAVGAHHLFGRAASLARAASALGGVNAAVVGLLAAALYDPVFTGAVHGVADAMVALAALVLLVAHVPPLAVVAGCVAFVALVA